MKKAGAGFLSAINSLGEAVTSVAAFFTLVSGLFKKKACWNGAGLTFILFAR